MISIESQHDETQFLDIRSNTFIFLCNFVLLNKTNFLPTCKETLMRVNINHHEIKL